MNNIKYHLPWEPKKLLWECPECFGINAWNYTDAERAEARLKKQTVKVSYGSCFDNICGHCGVNIVKQNSPILSECFTHQETSV